MLTRSTAQGCTWMGFRPYDLPVEPWRNGKGVTRTVASAGAGTDVSWRLSIATVDRAAEFSRFLGVERCCVLLGGAGLLLQGERGPLALEEIGTLCRFAGEEALRAVPGARAAYLWNVMTRRDAARAQVEVVHGRRACLDGAVATAVFVLEGLLEIGITGHPRRLLLGGQGGVLTGAPAPVRLSSRGGRARWVTTRILPS